MSESPRRELLAACAAVAAALGWIFFVHQPPHAPKLEGASCRDAYLKLYGRRSIDVRILFGYKDARPARFVGDRYERALLVADLLKPCAPGQIACGFTRSRTDADLFAREVPGPDGLPRTVRVTVTDSSVGPDDEGNREDPYQQWRTAYAQRIFDEGIRGADVVLYDGHSRSGGGPDFEPPRIGPLKHVLYSWYKANQPGLRHLEATLKAGHPAVELLGLFSCASDRLFAERITAIDPDLGIIASHQLIYFSDALVSMMDSLAALMEMKCQPEFETALTARSPQAGTELTGFFPAITETR